MRTKREIQHILARNHFTFSNLLEKHALIKNNLLTTLSRTLQTRAIISMQNSQTLNPKKLQQRHLLYLSNSFLLTTLCEIPAVCSQTCLLLNNDNTFGAVPAWVQCLPITNGLTVTSSIMHYLINTASNRLLFCQLLFTFCEAQCCTLCANLLDSFEYKTL